MELLVQADANTRARVAFGERDRSAPSHPYQRSFLSPLPITGDRAEKCRPARRRCRSLSKSDVELLAGNADTRTPLRTRSGDFLPPLYTLGDHRHAKPADANTIIQSAEALLAYRFRRGAKIFRDPQLLLSFLRITLVSQPHPVFAVFFMDHKQRLIRFSQVFRGSGRQINVPTREVLREALDNQAELVMCVRSDSLGDRTPRLEDIHDAQRLNRALNLLNIELMDYLIVGESITSLRERHVI
jgi:DNA repair protein RadC